MNYSEKYIWPNNNILRHIITPLFAKRKQLVVLKHSHIVITTCFECYCYCTELQEQKKAFSGVITSIYVITTCMQPTFRHRFSCYGGCENTELGIRKGTKGEGGPGMLKNILQVDFFHWYPPKQ